MIIIGFLSIIAAALAAVWAFSSKPAPAKVNLFHGIVHEQPKAKSNLLPTLGKYVPKPLTKGLDIKLMRAGYPHGLDLPRYLGIKAALAAMLAVLGLVLGQPLVALAGAFLGFFTPDLWLGRVRDDRQEQVSRSVADIIDQLTICVEAGLGFDAALRRVASTNDGPLAEELAHAVADISAGVPRDQALRTLVERVEIPEVKQVVLALIQAQKHGVPISETLRIQAIEMRTRRRQQIEEKAAKLPVKILLPTILFIMPALFIVLLGPAMVSLVHGLTAFAH